MARTMNAATLATIAGLAMATTGCQVGPAAMKMGHSEYASALGRILDEQLLLNLVRLRYRATPVWLDVSSISTQFEAAASGNIGGTLNENVSLDGAKNPDSLNLGAGVAYAERPTITYSILSGQDFIMRLLAPIPVTSISLLAGSGWRGDRVLNLTVERLNGLKNAPQASGPTPAQAPHYRDFQEAVGLMHKLAQQELIEFEFATRSKIIGDPIPAEKVDGEMVVSATKVSAEFRLVDEGKKMVLTREEHILSMRVAERAAESPEVKRLRQLLHLTPSQSRYDLVTAAEGDYDPLEPDREVTTISVGSRSLMGVMYYLSHAVDVPPEHKMQGLVTETVDEGGNVFDWAELLGSIFTVHCGKARPVNAHLAVRYRGNWYWIASDDESSLSTFALLHQLAALSSGERQEKLPVLTLPIGK